MLSKMSTKEGIKLRQLEEEGGIASLFFEYLVFCYLEY